MNSGFLIINKPVDWTSHDVVAKLRKITGIQKIGHAGTLDPFATGVLILGIGREATRELNKFLKQDKEYIAALHLGATSDTYDKTGQIKQLSISNEQLTIKEIKKNLKKFKGAQEQLPPMYSAKKINGKKLYELARAGKKVKRKKQKINIYKIKLLEYAWPILKIKIKCSSGTYIRTLGFDIGEKLGAGAYLEELRRTKIGKIKLKRAVDLEDINENNWKKILTLRRK